MIQKWVRDLIERYSFITKTEISQGQLKICYENNGKESFVRMPLRGGKRMLINRIDKIKEDINFKSKQAEIAIKTRQALVSQPFYFEVVKCQQIQN